MNVGNTVAIDFSRKKYDTYFHKIYVVFHLVLFQVTWRIKKTRMELKRGENVVPLFLHQNLCEFVVSWHYSHLDSETRKTVIHTRIRATGIWIFYTMKKYSIQISFVPVKKSWKMKNIFPCILNIKKHRDISIDEHSPFS